LEIQELKREKQKKEVKMDEIINNNHHPTGRYYSKVVQNDLDGKPVQKLRVSLTDKQLKILTLFYLEFKPISTIFIEAKTNFNIKTIKKAMMLLEINGLIKRIQAQPFIGVKAYTLADNRYKYYAITPEGEDEWNYQIKVRPWEHFGHNANIAETDKNI